MNFYFLNHSTENAVRLKQLSECEKEEFGTSSAAKMYKEITEKLDAQKTVVLWLHESRTNRNILRIKTHLIKWASKYEFFHLVLTSDGAKNQLAQENSANTNILCCDRFTASVLEKMLLDTTKKNQFWEMIETLKSELSNAEIKKNIRDFIENKSAKDLDNLLDRYVEKVFAYPGCDKSEFDVYDEVMNEYQIIIDTK